MPFPFLLALLAAQSPPPRQDDPAEIVVPSPARPTPQTAATIVAEPAALLIATFDADGDAITTRAEMEAGVERSFAAADTAHAGRLRYLQFADWALRWLGDRNALPGPFETDRDGDGQVTLAELQAQFARLYARYNTDGDGGISRAELLTFRTAPVGKDGPTSRGDRRRERAEPRRPR